MPKSVIKSVSIQQLSRHLNIIVPFIKELNYIISNMEILSKTGWTMLGGIVRKYARPAEWSHDIIKYNISTRMGISDFHRNLDHLAYLEEIINGIYEVSKAFYEENHLLWVIVEGGTGDHVKDAEVSERHKQLRLAILSKLRGLLPDMQRIQDNLPQLQLDLSVLQNSIVISYECMSEKDFEKEYSESRQKILDLTEDTLCNPKYICSEEQKCLMLGQIYSNLSTISDSTKGKIKMIEMAETFEAYINNLYLLKTPLIPKIVRDNILYEIDRPIFFEVKKHILSVLDQARAPKMEQVEALKAICDELPVKLI